MPYFQLITRFPTYLLKVYPNVSDTPQVMKGKKQRQQSLLMKFLGIFTPDEISKLTTMYVSERSIPLVDLAKEMLLPSEQRQRQEKQEEKQAEDGGEGAKILPLNSTEEEQAGDLRENHLVVRAGEQCLELLKKLSSGPFASGQDQSVPLSDAIVSEKKSASIFILEEQKKLNIIKKKMESQGLVTKYGNALKMDVKKSKSEEGEKEEVKKTLRTKGSLINKKIA